MSGAAAGSSAGARAGAALLQRRLPHGRAAGPAGPPPSIRAELQADGAALEPVVHAHPAPVAAVDEQVARAFVEAKSLAGVFARLGADARPALAWRCTHVAQALSTAINETLGKD